ncbi:MAG: DUF1254 domain-containing protein [bacterium]
MNPSNRHPDLSEITRTAEEAYIFAYPILENYRTMDRVTGLNTPAEMRRAFNTLRHTDKLLGPDFKNIVAPNNDTLYSSSWLDLKQGPLVLSVPEIPDRRYYVFQLVNLYNHNFGYIGARTTGYEPGNYLITGYDWQGTVPEGIRQVFPSESRFAFLLGRTLVDGPGDLEKVRAIQKGYRLQSLDQYLGHPPAPQPPDRQVRPWEPEKAQTADFIDALNYVLGNARIHPDEAAMINRFSLIGIEPGKPFDGSALPGDVTAAIETGIHQALDRIKQKVQAIGRKVNGWNSMAGSHGPREVMAGRYLVNAAGAMAGLYGNDEAEASNFVAFLDGAGNPLDGTENRYTLRFETGQLPPVHAFWSITMYRLPEILLVHNPIERYAVGDRDRELHYGDDGSLEILLQHESPEANRVSNWLPTPPGPFALALRCYLPDQDRFPTYEPPGIQRTGGGGERV